MSQCVMEQPAVDEPLVETDFKAAAAPAERRSIYYGWLMLPLSMAALIASSPGQTFGISIFNEPMRLSLGLSHGQMAAAYTLGTLLGAIPITFIGRQMDRHGLRRTLLAVVSLFSLACVGTSLVQGWLTLVGGFCFLRMLGPGALALLSGNTLAFWFERRLGMVEGLRQVGMAVAMASIPALNLWLVSQWGWRGAYGLLGAFIWLLLFPLTTLLFRNRPSDVGQQIDGIDTPGPGSPLKQNAVDAYWGFTLGETLRMPVFWTVTIGTATFSLIHTAIFFCMVPMFQERGLSAGDVAASLTVFAVCLAVMQLVGGMLADRVRASFLISTGLVGLAMTVLLLLVANSQAMALLAGGALGVSQGIFFGATHPLWARYFGRRHLGKIRGMLMTVNVACSSLGPLFAGVTRDWQGDFTLALIVFAIAPLPIAACSFLVAPPKREIATRDPASASAEPAIA